MLIRLLFATLHLLGLGVGLGAVWARARALRGPLDAQGLGRVFYADSWWGVAAAIWIGVRREWRETVNVGVVFFVLFLYVRYFDWWWDSMPKYLFFLLLGLTAVAILLILRRARAGGLHLRSAAP